MWNIIRAQFYQLVRDKVTWFVLFFTIALNAVFSFGIVVEDAGETLSGSYVVANIGSMYCISSLLFLMIIMANAMGKDFMDKTLNYEILSGHSRNEVFFGRFIVAMLTGMTGTLLIMILFPCIITVISGWGTAMEMQGILLRYTLIFISLFRICCELALFTILTKNPYVTYLVGFLAGYLQMLLPMAQTQFPDWFADANPVVLAVWNCLDLLNFQENASSVLHEAGPILYQSSVGTAMITQTIGVSVTVGVAALVIGSIYFQKNDLN